MAGAEKPARTSCVLRIGLGLVFLAVCYAAFRLIGGGTTFADLPRLPGEQVLWEERELDVRRLGNGVSLHPWCRVQVSDRRILIGQRGLLQEASGDGQALLYVLVPEQGQDSLRGGFQTLYCPPEQVVLAERDGAPCLVFPLPSSALHEALEVFSGAPDSLLAAVRQLRKLEAE